MAQDTSTKCGWAGGLWGEFPERARGGIALVRIADRKGRKSAWRGRHKFPLEQLAGAAPAETNDLYPTNEDLSRYRAQHKLAIPLTLDESGALFRSFRVMHVQPVKIAVDGKLVRRIERYDENFAADLASFRGR